MAKQLSTASAQPVIEALLRKTVDEGLRWTRRGDDAFECQVDDVTFALSERRHSGKRTFILEAADLATDEVPFGTALGDPLQKLWRLVREQEDASLTAEAAAQLKHIRDVLGIGT